MESYKCSEFYRFKRIILSCAYEYIELRRYPVSEKRRFKVYWYRKYNEEQRLNISLSCAYKLVFSVYTHGRRRPAYKRITGAAMAIYNIILLLSLTTVVDNSALENFSSSTMPYCTSMISKCAALRPSPINTITRLLFFHLRRCTYIGSSLTTKRRDRGSAYIIVTHALAPENIVEESERKPISIPYIIITAQ